MLQAVPPPPAPSPVPPASAVASAARPGRSRRQCIALFGLPLLVVLALLLGQFAFTVPHALQNLLPAWVKEKTGRELRVGHASFNPLTLHLVAGDVTLKDGDAPLARLEALELRGAWSSLIHLAWTADELTLKKPAIEARIGSDGTLDWERFLAAFPAAKATPGDSVPRVLLRNISVAGGSVHLRDQRAAQGRDRLALAPLSFRIDKLSTLPRDRGDYTLEATLNDQTRVHWQGRVGLNPIESSGEITIRQLPLTRVAAIAGWTLPVALEGVAALRANYSAAFGTDFAAAGLGDGVLEVSGLRASQGGDQARLTSLRVTPVSASWAKTRIDGREQHLLALLPLQLSARGLDASVAAQSAPLFAAHELASSAPITVDLAARQVTVPGLRIDGLQAALWRGADGAWAMPFAGVGAPQQAVSTAAATPPATPTAAATPPATPTAAATPPATSTAAAGEQSAPWRVTLDELTTDGARLDYRDHRFATPQHLSATLDATLGASVEWGAQPGVRLRGKRLALNAISLRDGAVTPTDSPGAAPAPPPAPPWLQVRALRAGPFDTALSGPKIELPRVEIIAPELLLIRDADGLDLARRLRTMAGVANAAATAGAASSANTTSAPGAATVAASTAAPSVHVAGVVLSGGRVTLQDNSLPVPQSHVLDAVTVTAERFVTGAAVAAKPIPVNARATLQSGGVFTASARYDMARQRGEADVMIERVALAAFAPYLRHVSRLTLDSGEASVSGKLAFNSVAPATGAGLAGETAVAEDSLRWVGSAVVREVKLTDRSTQKPFAQWAELSSQDMRLANGAGGWRIELADLLLDQPRGDIVIGEDGVLNLTQIGKTGTSAASAPAPAAATATPTASTPLTARVRVDRLQVTGGDIHFADLSLRPQFGTRVSDLSGLVVGINSEASSRAEVSLEGKVDDYGLARLSGTIAPASAAQYTDLKASFRNLDMRNLTPYSGKFAGREIEAGKLSLELEYKVQDRKLKGENQIVIDNVRLGERIESRDATSLPLDLAVALLSDSNGIIELGLPVQGSLDEPQFSLGGLVGKAIRNLLAKIASAPFRALGALLGGSGEEFEAVLFEPGEARLLPPEREKLARLATALEKRPQLKLAIEGRFDRERDRDALADNILKLEVSQRAGMKPPGANEPLVISFTDSKVQSALDELAARAGDDAAKLRAQFLPPAGNALTGLLQGARERLTEKGRSEAADARNKYYPELFRLLRSKQAVPDIAFSTLAGFRAEAVRNTLTAVNKFDTARVSVAAPQPVKTSQPDRVATTLALSVK